MGRSLGPPIVFLHECTTGPTTKRSERPLLNSRYICGGKTFFTYVGIVQTIFYVSEEWGGFFVSLRTVSVLLLFFFCYFTCVSKISCVECSSTVLAERFQAFTSHHTKQRDLTQKGDWNKPFYIFGYKLSSVRTHHINVGSTGYGVCPYRSS